MLLSESDAQDEGTLRRLFLLPPEDVEGRPGGKVGT